MKKAFFVKIFCFSFMFPFLLVSQIAFADQPSHHIFLLKEMFAKVTVEKNDKAISSYYCKDFELHSNGETMKFNEFL